MKRKLVKQGEATMMVSLPAKWIQKNNLNKGDEIDIDELDDALVIKTQGPGKEIKKKIEIELNDDNRELVRIMLIHIYRVGYDTVTIKNIDNKTSEEIRRVAKELLLGFEVTSRTATTITLENLSEPTDEKYETILRRTFFTIKETINTLNEEVKANSTERFNEVEELRNQSDRMIMFCRRLVWKRGGKLYDWELLTFLNHIDHAMYYFFKSMKDSKSKKINNPAVVRFVDGLTDYFGLFYDAYFNKDIGSINKIQNQRNKYQFGGIIDELQKSKGIDSVSLSYLREIYRMIQMGTSPLYNEILSDLVN